jgi:hypothetical protein
MPGLGWWLGAAVVAGLLVPLAPALRRRAVMRTAAKVAQAAYPAVPGSDWPSLYARLSARYVGARVGAAVAVAATLVLIATTSGLPDPFVVVGFVAVSAGQSFGALVGNLVGARHLPAVGSPVAAMTPRELRGYLPPREALLARVVPWVSALGVAVELLWWVDARDGAALAAAGVCAMCTVAALAAGRLAKRTLHKAMPVSTDGGLVWAEVLRAMLLRDAYAGLGAVAATGTGLAAILALSAPAAPDAVPGWVRVASVVLLAAAIGASTVLGWASMEDNHHRWARAHVPAAVA